jgi:hypothetical protein
MKTNIALPLIALLFLALACSLLSPEQPPALPESEQRCGDGVCDGPENVDSCPQDCKEVSDTGEAAEQGGGGAFDTASSTTSSSTASPATR